MPLKLHSSALLVLLALPAPASADIYSFTLKKGDGQWQCAPVSRPEDKPFQVVVGLPKPAPPETDVDLNVQVDFDSGDPVKGKLEKSKAAGEDTLWRLTHTSTQAKAKLVTVSGTVSKLPVEGCSGPVKSDDPPPPASRVTMTAADVAAAEWLEEHDWKFDLLRPQVHRRHPKWPLDRIVFLPHLPSGAKAPSYPTSISERDLAVVVMVVPDVGGDPGAGGTIDWTLSRCETIPTYRVYGSIEGLAEAQAKRRPDEKRDFKIIRVGHPMTCGADALTYSIVVTSDKAVAGDPIQSTLAVRPVYHLGATGMFGFDRTMQSTFVARDGKIDEVKDRVGPGLLVGATYFVNGVDFGDMRWYNHVLNPFVVVSLESPKDRFVVGTALTQRGGISLGVGIAFNHVSTLASGYTEGQAFAGPGDIPQDKTWKTGFYIGVGVDDKLLSSFRKLKKSGTGGGTAAPNAEEEAKKKQAEEAKQKEDAKKKEDAAKKGEGATDKKN